MPYSIVICSRNLDNLRECVGALRAAGETGRVIVVSDFDDHDFVDADMLDAETDKFVLGEKPFCFARNANIGIEKAGTDDVVLLNDDALLEDGEGLRALGRVEERGIVAATTNVTGYIQQWRRHVDDHQAFRPVSCAAFVCVYIPRATIERVGLLDERFTAYGGEDVDYCLRVREAGLLVGVSDFCYVDHSKLTSTFRGPHPTNGAPGDTRESNRIGREKWGDKWPHR